MNLSRIKLLLQDQVLQIAKKGQATYFRSAYQRLKEESPASFSIPTPTTILIFKPDDIGDGVQALPALAELKRLYPNAKFSILCQEKTAPLYVATGFFEVVIPVRTRTKFLRFHSFDVPSLPKFDLAIFLRTYPMFFEEFKRLKAVHKIFPNDPRLSLDAPTRAKVDLEGKRNLQALQLLQIVAPLTKRSYESKDIVYPKLEWSAGDREFIDDLLSKKLAGRKMVGVLHPFNRLETKAYPMEYWKTLHSHLERSLPYTWIVIGGKEDPRLGWPKSGSRSLIELQGELTLGQTGYLLSKSQAFIGNESGPGHLAAALGIPTVTLMGGHSNPKEWAAIGNSLILRHEVSCSPCHLRVCAFRGLKCLKEMTPGRVFGEIETFLEKDGPPKGAPPYFETRIGNGPARI